MVASREGEIENPGPDDIYRVGVAGTVARMIKVPDGTLRILVHGSQRVQIGEFVQREPYLAAKVDRAARPDRALARARGAVPQRADHLLADHRGGPLPARGAAARGHQPRGPGRAGAHDRRGAAHQDRGAPGAARGARRGEAPAPPVRAARPRARADLDRHQDPVAGRVRDRQGPARVLPAPAAQGDPGGAGRGRRDPGRGQELREQIEAAELPEHAASRPSASCSASSACPRSPPSTG